MLKKIKSHFKFNKRERSGIFFLLLTIIVLQVIYYTVKYQTPYENGGIVFFDSIQQATIDSLKQVSAQKDSIKIYPFNPNFITDYKGYILGMAPIEIDRLHVFRETGSYVNSAIQFQGVTKISDSLLKVLSPFFRFPEWTQNQGNTPKANQNSGAYAKIATVRDLNSISAEDLKIINGIGDKLSTRIIKFRDRLGGFLINEQLYDVYGLKVEVADRALKRFQVLNRPQIKTIDINAASISEISELVYIPYKVADKIIEFREHNGRINSIDELKLIEGFPTDKLDRIALYLSF